MKYTHKELAALDCAFTIFCHQFPPMVVFGGEELIKRISQLNSSNIAIESVVSSKVHLTCFFSTGNGWDEWHFKGYPLVAARKQIWVDANYDAKSHERLGPSTDPALVRVELSWLPRDEDKIWAALSSPDSEESYFGDFTPEGLVAFLNRHKDAVVSFN